MKNTWFLIPIILMYGCSMNPYGLTKEQADHIEFIEYQQQSPKVEVPIMETVELLNGDVLLPPHEVRLTIDPKDVVYFDGVPYVNVDGVYYQIVEFLPSREQD